ncbi:hypothetical protein [Paractinoplanes atraurantiacus]|uniref:Uncharacterized protein n=1 Tax=Paractinoplanes atraurantiacus TaxID=1036182 RepID=A0A285J6N9_9ACTN|nr:hypothetical protein [Actinoplanes atraurantiacus]SNY54761.1 hypothetical protein SAMN05421748_115151 [Actinoplanes atraurantiacus]
MIVARQLIVDELRRRGQSKRAEFVEEQLPDEVDSTRHGGLLATLHIDLAELVAAAERRPAD